MFESFGWYFFYVNWYHTMDPISKCISWACCWHSYLWRHQKSWALHQPGNPGKPKMAPPKKKKLTWNVKITSKNELENIINLSCLYFCLVRIFISGFNIGRFLGLHTLFWGFLRLLVPAAFFKKHDTPAWTQAMMYKAKRVAETTPKPTKKMALERHPKLVGGWTNPFEKYARQIGSFPQG